MPHSNDTAALVDAAFQEVILNEQLEEAFIDKEIDEFYRRNVHNSLDLPKELTSHVFGQDGSVQKWNRKYRDLMVRYICGDCELKGPWMSDDADLFRRSVRESFRYEFSLFAEAYPQTSLTHAMRALPPCFVLPPLLSARSEMPGVACSSAPLHASTSETVSADAGGCVVSLRVWYSDMSGCLCSAVFCIDGTSSAQCAVAFVTTQLSHVARVDSTGRLSPHQDDIAVFRVRSQKEYIYGDEPLRHFRYVRKCEKAKDEANVVVEHFPREHFTDPLFRPSYQSVVLPNWTHDEIVSGLGADANVKSVWDHTGPLCVYLYRLADRLNALCKRCVNVDSASHGSFRTGSARHTDGVFRNSSGGGVDSNSFVDDYDAIASAESGVFDVAYLALLVDVYFGREACCQPLLSSWVARKYDAPSWAPTPVDAHVHCTAITDDNQSFTNDMEGVDKNEELAFDVELSNLPREARLCFTLVGARGSRSSGPRNSTVRDVVNSIDHETQQIDHTEKQFVFLSSGTLYLYSFDATMRTGDVSVLMFRNSHRATVFGFSANCDSLNCEPIRLSVRLPDFGRNQMMYPSGRPPAIKHAQSAKSFKDRESKIHSDLRNSEIEQLRQLKRVFCRDLLTELSDDDKVIIWRHRHTLLQFPNALPKFLSSVDWLQPYDVYQAHCLIRRWEPLGGFDALCLLDARYADTVARDQAIMFVDTLSDYELRNCILQLVQVLRYEAYHCSSLARFLLKRFFECDHLVGHYIFWHMTAEVHNTTARERYGLMLEEIITRSPLRRQYLRQVYVTNQLLRCVLMVQQASKKDRISTLQANLALLRLPHRFVLPLNSAMECCALDIVSCRVMDSKKFPLWLAFRSYFEPENRFYVIFKSGDDLRQDCLTLQLLEIMDTIWKANSLDLNITTYGCVSTGKDVGMIEAVLDSETIANITRSDGGAQAAFSDEPLLRWLRQFNHTRDDIQRCIKNFIHSVAGYIVASYILGIGDRHNDNIMLCTNGTLFHIDFSHFLGNYKSKFGFKRETAPFIFTPMFCHVMGGVHSPIYKHFVELASYAYNVVRRYGNMLIMLFLLMLPTGIAELKTKEDVYWLRGVLLSGSSNESAVQHYKSLIAEALNNKRTLINDYIHILAH